jgi:hypothetical protein
MFKETEIEHYIARAYAIPLTAGGFAFLSGCSIGPAYITLEERWYTTTWDYWGGHDILAKCLNEIKSGVGNTIINPQKDTKDVKWGDLVYSNARILERDTKITKSHTYKGT